MQKECYNSFLKIKPFKIVFIALFLFIPFFASANCVGDWKMSPTQSGDRDYEFYGYNGTDLYYYNFATSTDTNGFSFWTSSSTISAIEIYPTNSQLAGTLKTSQNGYKLWIFSTWNGATDNYFRYKNNLGENKSSTTGTVVDDFAVAGTTIYSRSWSGFSDDPTDEDYPTSPFSEINVDQPKITTGDTRIYAIIYTNEDLSTITNQTDLYSFLNSLNSITCTSGASGGWGEEAPDASNYNFADTDFGYLGNMFRDVIIWAIQPKDGTLEKYANLQTVLEGKAPFAYFFDVRNALNSFNASSSPVFSLSTAGDITTDIFSPLKTGLTWILWIFFGFWVIRKISNFNF